MTKLFHKEGKTGNISKDMTHLLSDEAIFRKPSPIKTTMKFFTDPDMIFLGAGMPPSNMFPLQEISFEAASPLAGSLECLSQANTKGYLAREQCDLELFQDIPLARALQYGNSRGQPELLEFLREHVRQFHKILYDDWDIITTAGSTQAWDATLRIFCNRGDSVLLESYTYSSSYEAAAAQGLNCVPMEMDQHGIIPEKLEQMLQDREISGRALPKILYTIPTGQNPTGCTLLDERKPQIMEIATKYDMIVIEDDPYYFLQMNPYGEPSTMMSFDKTKFVDSLSKSLMEWDHDGRVVRLESVSKTFAPGCRLGWLIGSKRLLDQYWNLHEVSMQSTCGFAQTLINGLLQRWGQNGYVEWLFNIRALYSLKRDHCLKQCFTYLPKEICSVNVPTSGMFFMIHIDPMKHPEYSSCFGSSADRLEAHLHQRFVENGIMVACASWFRVGKINTNQLAFRGTFASVDPDKMKTGIELMSRVIMEEFCLK